MIAYLVNDVIVIYFQRIHSIIMLTCQYDLSLRTRYVIVDDGDDHSVIANQQRLLERIEKWHFEFAQRLCRFIADRLNGALTHKQTLHVLLDS